jgi:hypothetical protein
VDVGLGDGDCLGVWAALAKRSIPFVFYTGYTIAPEHSAWPDAPSLDKPTASGTMIDEILQLLPSPAKLEYAQMAVVNALPHNRGREPSNVAEVPSLTARVSATGRQAPR